MYLLEPILRHLCHRTLLVKRSVPFFLFKTNSRFQVDKLCALRFNIAIKAYDCNSPYYEREGSSFIISTFECFVLSRPQLFKGPIIYHYPTVPICAKISSEYAHPNHSLVWGCTKTLDNI